MAKIFKFELPHENRELQLLTQQRRCPLSNLRKEKKFFLPELRLDSLLQPDRKFSSRALLKLPNDSTVYIVEVFAFIFSTKRHEVIALATNVL